MVKYKSSQLDATFSALSDPTRRAILAHLSLGEASVTELAQPFEMSLPAISKHLRVLEAAGLLGRTREGRVHRLNLQARPMKQAQSWMQNYRSFWDHPLDSLAPSLENFNESFEPL